MRWVAQSLNALENLARVGVLGSLALLAGVAVPSWGAESSPWQKGEYRNFIPGTPTPSAPAGVTVRSLGPTLQLSQTAVQRPRLRPGDLASLRAQYTVMAPSGPVDVKETRILRFNGAVLTTLTQVVSRSSGLIGSEYQLKIPGTAAAGWYTVTTLIEPATPTTRGIAQEQANATFYIELEAASSTTTPAPPPEGTRVDDDGVRIKLWANKPRFKVGDTLTLSFEANRDAYVTLVNVGTSGALTILFPNRFSGGHAVKAKTVYTIPGPDDNYEMALSGPPGTELIYALVTLKPVQFLDTDFSRTPQIFQSVTRGAVTFTRDINAVAKKTPLKEQAKTTLDLEVVP